MRTSLTEIRTMEQYLDGTLPPGDRLVFEAKLITDREWALNTRLQQTLMSILNLFQRKHTRQQVIAIHDKLFNSGEKAAFRSKVTSIFN
jgi:hypothetical protein